MRHWQKKQDAYAQETEDQQNKLASIKADMNANQLRVYLDYGERHFYLGEMTKRNRQKQQKIAFQVQRL